MNVSDCYHWYDCCKACFVPNSAFRTIKTWSMFFLAISSFSVSTTLMLPTQGRLPPFTEPALPPPQLESVISLQGSGAVQPQAGAEEAVRVPRGKQPGGADAQAEAISRMPPSARPFAVGNEAKGWLDGASTSLGPVPFASNPTIPEGGGRKAPVRQQSSQRGPISQVNDFFCECA